MGFIKDPVVMLGLDLETIHLFQVGLVGIAEMWVCCSPR